MRLFYQALPIRDALRHKFDVNTLTVVATESYEEFAAHLQKEMEADTGIRFGMVERHQFAAIALAAEDGSTRPLGVEQSAAIWDCLHQASGRAGCCLAGCVDRVAG